jgi:hypothetical protein
VIAALLLAAAVASPARAASVKLFAYDEKGAALGLPGLLAPTKKSPRPTRRPSGRSRSTRRIRRRG